MQATCVNSTREVYYNYHSSYVHRLVLPQLCIYVASAYISRNMHAIDTWTPGIVFGKSLAISPACELCTCNEPTYN